MTLFQIHLVVWMLTHKFHILFYIELQFLIILAEIKQKTGFTKEFSFQLRLLSSNGLLFVRISNLFAFEKLLGIAWSMHFAGWMAYLLHPPVSFTVFCSFLWIFCCFFFVFFFVIFQCCEWCSCLNERSFKFPYFFFLLFLLLLYYKII